MCSNRVQTLTDQEKLGCRGVKPAMRMVHDCNGWTGLAVIGERLIADLASMGEDLFLHEIAERGDAL